MNADVLIMLYAIDAAHTLTQSCIETLLPIARTHVPDLPIVLVGTKEELLHDISLGAEVGVRAALQLVEQAEKVCQFSAALAFSCSHSAARWAA